MVHNRKPTQEWLHKDESASPTVATDSLFHTMSMDAKENRDVMTADVPNAFTQTDMPDGDDEITMKITGVSVQMSVEDSPQAHGDHVAHKNEKKVRTLAIFADFFRSERCKSMQIV